ncbi:MAG: mannonate dehydratase [Chloroflexi bacterium]|nr:mannonate dehydratase [Chloroflexota bacterium]
MSGTMRISIGLPRDATDEHLIYARQLGCDGVVLATPSRLPGDECWEYEDLARLREWVESFGLRIEALQNVPHEFWMKVRLGESGRDEQMENYLQTIRNMGRAGIPVLGHNFRPHPLYRTGTAEGRGGAIMTTYDRAALQDELTFGREISADEMWANYEYFVRAAVPVAEEAGVRLALHPDDPNDGPIGGVARIFSSFEGFERASQLTDSPAWGLLFCIGCWTEMGGTANVLRGIRHFGSQGRIVYVHFRDIMGTASSFSECFIGSGVLDVTAAMRTLHGVGFSGPIIDDHAPQTIGDDDPWHPRARGYQTGYLQGLLRAVVDLSDAADTPAR